MSKRFIYGSESDFTNTKNAVKLKNEDIQEMIDDVTKRLNEIIKNNSENNSTFQGTGDTMVFGFAFDGDDDDKLDEMNIFVCRNYEEAQGWFDKNGKFEKMDWSIDYEKEELEREKEKYKNYTRDELLDIIVHRADYNPYKEV